jgi:sulfate permease, SulP family
MSAAATDASVAGRVTGFLRTELAPRHVLASMNAAVILYLFQIILALSFAALIFSGDLAPLLPHTVNFVLAGTALLVGVTTLLNAGSGSIPSAQDTPAVVLGLAAASAAAATAGAPAEDRFATVLVLVIGTTMTMGFVCLALGIFRLGRLVRFLPYPVMGGFLAGTGWLLTMGGIRVTTDAAFGPALLEPGAAARWAPALVVSLLSFIAVWRWRTGLVLPVLLAAAAIVFYLVMGLGGRGPDRLSAEGWLLGPFPEGITAGLPLTPEILSRVQWPALVGALPLAAPAIILGVVAMLLNASSLELVIRRDVRLNRELFATGVANVAAGAAGGLPGFSGISVSTLGHALAPGRRLPGLLIAVLLLLTVVFGTALLSLVPRLVLGGLLAYIGLSLLYEWVIRARSTFATADYAIVVSVLAVIVTTNMMWGLALGLALTVLLFVVSYSRVTIIRYQISAAEYRSRVTRNAKATDLLQAHGTEFLIFKLQSFIFFGTANQLFEHVRERTAERGSKGVRAVLLDFEQVTGLDSTALLAFQKMVQVLQDRGIELILTGLDAQVTVQLEAGGIGDRTGGVQRFRDLDHGVEWIEEQILAAEPDHPPTARLADQLQASLPDEPRLLRIIEWMERRDVEAGEVIIRQGDEPDALFFLESGQLTAQLEKPGREPVRLETMTGGRIVGEIGFFLGTPRSASVVADRPSVVYVLTRDAWVRLLADDPDLASAFSRLTIRILGQRVAHLTRVVDALQQ